MEQPTSQQTEHAPAGEGGSELRADAQQLGSSAANRLHSEVDARKEQAVDQVKSVSSAVQQAAGQLGQDSPEWLKSALRSAGEQIQRFADTIEHKNSRELLSDVQGFARDNPGTFLAACAAAGFAAARIFKAGAEPQAGGTVQGANQSRAPGESA
jgi:ElaB/YqjD/DUF883 family membrane-anchored ribosome-binding protein